MEDNMVWVQGGVHEVEQKAIKTVSLIRIYCLSSHRDIFPELIKNLNVAPSYKGWAPKDTHTHTHIYVCLVLGAV